MPNRSLPVPIVSALIVAVAVLSVLVAGVADEGQSRVNRRVTIDGRLIIAETLERSPYRSWELWPGTRGFRQAARPHGPYATTFVNEEAYDALQRGEDEMPHGAIIVLESYDQRGVLDAISIMYKKYAYSDRTDDWWFLQYAPVVGVSDHGEVEWCVACHGQQRFNDWLYTQTLD
jgi:hypothetical protein